MMVVDVVIVVVVATFKITIPVYDFLVYSFLVYNFPFYFDSSLFFPKRWA